MTRLDSNHNYSVEEFSELCKEFLNSHGFDADSVSDYLMEIDTEDVIKEWNEEPLIEIEGHYGVLNRCIDNVDTKRFIRTLYANVLQRVYMFNGMMDIFEFDRGYVISLL